MPMKSGASKKAFEYNKKKSMKEGKSKKQSTAIAYSKKKQSEKKGK